MARREITGSTDHGYVPYLETMPNIRLGKHGRGRQCAVLPLTQQDGEAQVLLATSRDTGRWALPKGWAERVQRRRGWFSLAQAAMAVEHGELALLLRLGAPEI